MPKENYFTHYLLLPNSHTHPGPKYTHTEFFVKNPDFVHFLPIMYLDIFQPLGVIVKKGKA